MNTLLTLVIYILVLGVILWLVTYVLEQFPLREPFGRIVRVIAVVIAVVILIGLLLDLANVGTLGLPRIR